MAKVVVTKSKLDILAQHINTKAGTTGAKTIAQMQATVDGITVGKEEEAVTVALDMASGDQIITPSEGKTLSQVTVTKPDDLLPSRVVLGSNIGGVDGNYFAPEIWVLNEEIVVPAQTLTFTDLDFLTCAAGQFSPNDPFPIQTSLIVSLISGGKVGIVGVSHGTHTVLKRPTATSSDNYTDTNGWYGEPKYPQIGRILVFLQPTGSSVQSWLRQNAVLYGGSTVSARKRGLFELGDIDFAKVLNVTANGAYSIKPNAPYSTFGSATVNVNVPVPAVQDTKAVTITSNGTVSVTPDAPYDAMKKVDVTVDGISTKMSVTWHQCPEAVRNYLANVAYDPGDYSNSQIADYAPATPVVANTKPIGKTVGGVTYYNDVPNVEMPFSTDSAAGTLKPLDALRWINTPHAPNVRDLGGWACDGGKVKYGMMFRGGDMDATDRNVLVGQCGVRAELNLRGKNEADYTPPTSSVLGTDILYYIPDIYQWYSIANKTVWRGMLRFAFDCVLHNQPVYFHCAAGADRTGTFACVIEALLGVSQSDIDKDYELTSFYSGAYSDAAARRRNESDWTGLINQINALPGSTFRDKVVGWVASLGFTAAEINAFRTAMIDGTPETVTPSVNTYTVTNTLTNATSDNSAASATEYQPYTAKIAPANGYVISSVQVKMGGADVTGSVWRGTQTVLRHKVTVGLTHCTSDNSRTSVIDGQGYAATLAAELGYTLEGATISITMGGVDVSTYYKDGVIAIPNVTGDLVITVTAVKQVQENMFPAHFFNTDGTTIFGNGKGYENGHRISSDLSVKAGTGRSVTGYLDVSGYTKMVVSGSTVGSATGGYPIVWLDSSRTAIGHDGAYETTSVPNGTWDIPSGANYVRLSCGLDPVDMVVNLE